MQDNIEGPPLPVKLEGVVTELRKVVDELEKLDLKKKELETTKDTLRGLIKDEMQVQGITKFSTPEGTVSGKMKAFNQIEDHTKLCDWVRETNHFEVFQRRLSNSAIEEIKKEGEEVPGIKSYEEFEITFRRSK